MSEARIAVWLALSELCLDTQHMVEDFARLSRILVESGLDDADIERAWLHEVGPACSANLLSVAGEWAGFERAWLIAEITRPRRLASRIRNALIQPLLRLGSLPDWRELQAWVALRRVASRDPGQLVRARRAMDPALRRRAVMLAAEAGSSQLPHLPPLARSLADPDAEVRRIVLAHDCNLTWSQITPLLGDTDEGVRRAAAAALARLAGPGDLARVREVLEHADALVYNELAPVLWHTASEPAVCAALLAMLHSPRTETRAAAARACTARWSEAAQASQPGPEVDISLCDALCAMLADEAAVARAAAVTALGWWHAWRGEAAAELTAYLASLADDPAPEVRHSTAFALGCAGRADPTTLAALGRTLGDPDRRVRMAALHTVRALGASAASLRPSIARSARSGDILESSMARTCLAALPEIRDI